MQKKLYSASDEVFRHEDIEEALATAWGCEPEDTEVLTVFEADIDDYTIVKVTPRYFRRELRVDSDDFDFDDFEEVPEPPNTGSSTK